VTGNQPRQLPRFSHFAAAMYAKRENGGVFTFWVRIAG
jgi:hypothetical protein